jgi:hypothetical protein
MQLLFVFGMPSQDHLMRLCETACCSIDVHAEAMMHKVYEIGAQHGVQADVCAVLLMLAAGLTCTSSPTRVLTPASPTGSTWEGEA